MSETLCDRCSNEQPNNQPDVQLVLLQITQSFGQTIFESLDLDEIAAQKLAIQKELEGETISGMNKNVQRQLQLVLCAACYNEWSQNPGHSSQPDFKTNENCATCQTDINRNRGELCQVLWISGLLPRTESGEQITWEQLTELHDTNEFGLCTPCSNKWIKDPAGSAA